MDPAKHALFMERKDNMGKHRIAVAGTGYAGLSLAALLAQHAQVTVISEDQEEAEKIGRCELGFEEAYIEKYFKEKKLALMAATDAEEACRRADHVIIALPGREIKKTEALVKLAVRCNPEAMIVIRTDVPIGFTRTMRDTTGSQNILYSPNFTQKERAFTDVLYPERIIIGTDLEDDRLCWAANAFAALLQEGALQDDIDVRFMNFDEAEAVKLLTNTAAALRIAYEHELDAFARENGLDAAQIKAALASDTVNVSAEQPVIPMTLQIR